jgi:glycosyltransferase involved in cell wall biosynthesis
VNLKQNNKIISQATDDYYDLVEPILLQESRDRCQHNYNDNDAPLISVYIPTYNRGKLLIERSVQSVLGQTYNNLELIIIGDVCTDNTKELIRSIDDNRIRFYNLSQRNYRYPPSAENNWFAGPVVAANYALDIIRGEWIARIDDDDIWTEDHLEKSLSFAIDNNFEFVSSNYIEKMPEGDIIPEVEYFGEDGKVKIGGTQTWLYRSYLSFMKYNINCWRKEWNRVNDTDLQDRMYRAGIRIGFLDNVGCHIYPRPGERHIGLKAYMDDNK